MAPSLDFQALNATALTGFSLVTGLDKKRSLPSSHHIQTFNNVFVVYKNLALHP